MFKGKCSKIVCVMSVLTIFPFILQKIIITSFDFYFICQFLQRSLDIMPGPQRSPREPLGIPGARFLQADALPVSLATVS